MIIYINSGTSPNGINDLRVWDQRQMKIIKPESNLGYTNNNIKTLDENGEITENPIIEVNLIQQIRNKVIEALENSKDSNGNSRFTVIGKTHTDKVSGTDGLAYRVNFYNMTSDNKLAECFLGLYLNQGDGKANGLSIITNKTITNKEKFMALHIKTQLIDKVGLKDNGVNVNLNHPLLSRLKVPSVLVFIGFIDNDSDTLILRDRQTEIADAITLGMENFMDNKYKYITAELKEYEIKMKTYPEYFTPEMLQEWAEL